MTQSGDRIHSKHGASCRRRNDLAVLAEISRTLNHASDLEDALAQVLAQVKGLYLYRRGYIAVVDHDTEQLHIAASEGYTHAERAALDDCPNHLAPSENRPSREGCVDVLLQTASGLLGMLCLEGDPPAEESRLLLGLLGDMLATTLEKNCLLDDAAREIGAQTLLNTAGRALTSTLDRRDVLTRIMGEAIQALCAEAGSVVLVDEDRGDLYFAAVASPRDGQLLGTRLSRGQGLVGWVVEHNQAVLTCRADQDARFCQQIDEQFGFQTQSILCVPLRSRDRVLGAIEVVNAQAGHFTGRDLRLLEALSPQAAIAIENASLFESVQTRMAILKQTQDQLVQTEKLSAIGRLVAGVAHELNNPLTAIAGYTDLLMQTCTDPDTRQDLDCIHRETQRCARIVRNLLAFARQQAMDKQPADLTSILNATLDLVRYQLQVDDIEVVCRLSAHRAMVLADVHQLQQVFLNVITNAHYAMRQEHGRGRLIVRSEYRGDQVWIYFEDDGPGVHPGIAGRIFDPFFTTKDVGEGTGLGLSICLGIIQNHQGRIWLEDRPFPGATFVIELPLYAQVEPDEHRDRESIAQVAGGPLSALVVDDEPEIARLLQRILSRGGFKVVTVYNGLQAQEALADAHFDVVICDLKMPGMGGRELYGHIKQHYPHLAQRVVFASGDTINAENSAFLRETHYIAKPFRPDQVLSQMRALVG